MLNVCECSKMLLSVLIERWFSATLVFSPASGFTFTSTKVKLHEAAALPCQYRCSGLVTWSRPSNKKDILAQCNQTLCQTKTGFQMFHDQYMEGNLSLTVTEADFSKRDWYTCKCSSKDICYVSLRLERKCRKPLF